MNHPEGIWPPQLQKQLTLRCLECSVTAFPPSLAHPQPTCSWKPLPLEALRRIQCFLCPALPLSVSEVGPQSHLPTSVNHSSHLHASKTHWALGHGWSWSDSPGKALKPSMMTCTLRGSVSSPGRSVLQRAQTKSL